MTSPQTPPSIPDADLREAMELLFFAYRDFTAHADAILAQQNMGRAHHRVVYFVGRHPGISVGELLEILAITKQSLSRVLSQLVREGYIAQKTGTADRRQRLLHLTEKGRQLESDLTADQRARIAAAYQKAGLDAVEGFRAVMLAIMEPAARRRFAPRVR